MEEERRSRYRRIRNLLRNNRRGRVLYGNGKAAPDVPGWLTVCVRGRGLPLAATLHPLNAERLALEGEETSAILAERRATTADEAALHYLKAVIRTDCHQKESDRAETSLALVLFLARDALTRRPEQILVDIPGDDDLPPTIHAL